MTTVPSSRQFPQPGDCVRVQPEIQVAAGEAWQILSLHRWEFRSDCAGSAVRAGAWWVAEGEQPIPAVQGMLVVGPVRIVLARARAGGARLPQRRAHPGRATNEPGTPTGPAQRWPGELGAGRRDHG